jgi:la-related protein 1
MNSNGFNQGGGPASRAQGPYSPPSRQGSQGQMYMPSTQRGGRGGRNGGSGNYHRMSLPNGSSRVPPVQTQFAGYDYPMPPMSAIPFQPAYWDHAMMPYIKSQIEYYFSIENLCKDMYLRKRMDSQGFVPLHFIAAFKRMRELSGDLGLIRAVCEESNEIDFVLGDDDCERLRRRNGWETFVLPVGERDELARNHGPNQFSFKSRSYHFGHPYNGMPPMPYGMASPPAYPIPGEVQYPPYAGELANGHGLNGMMNGGAVNGHAGPSQLSADVPDFSPSQPLDKGVNTAGQPDGESSQVNGHATEALTNGLTNGVHAEQASS